MHRFNATYLKRNWVVSIVDETNPEAHFVTTPHAIGAPALPAGSLFMSSAAA
jgi:hypothetical protein